MTGERVSSETGDIASLFELQVGVILSPQWNRITERLFLIVVGLCKVLTWALIQMCRRVVGVQSQLPSDWMWDPSFIPNHTFILMKEHVISGLGGF